MPRVHIVHSTRYRYLSPVRFTTHRLMVRPRDSHDLRVRGATLTLTPPAATVRWAHDVFGNSVCYVDWDQDITADTLQIVSTLDVEHFPASPELPREAVDPLAETYPFSYAPEEFPDLARQLERHYLDPGRRVDAWARQFLQKGGPTRTMDLLVAMTQAIKSDFTYAARDAEGTNSPLVTLETKSGACRDFALLLMEAARSLGFAARFVSGYLYDEGPADSAPAQVGGGATHAWCGIYLPGAGWVDFDPTNGLVAGRNLIRVCTARTPEQAVPIGGGFIGPTGGFAGMTVNVEATVGEGPAEA